MESPAPAAAAPNMVIAAIEDAAQVGIKRATSLWNTWAWCLCTYAISPIVLIGTFFGASASMQVITIRNETAPALPGTCDDLYVYSSLNNTWKVYLSLIPIYLVIWGVLLMNKGSQIVAPAALVVTSVLCLLYFADEGLSSSADMVQSAGLVLLTVVDRVLWTVFEYAYNVFAAFLFLRVLQLWGIVGYMKDEFEVQAYSPERKVLLIMFNFAVMIAVVAPGGSNFLISGAILLDMNVMGLPEGREKEKYDLRVGVLCLFGNTITSAFNLVGVCIIALAGDVIGVIDENGANYPCAVGDEKCAQKQIGLHFSAQMFLLCTLVPLWMTWIFTRNIFTRHFLTRELALHLGCGLLFAIAQVLTAYYIGPELPCLLAAGASTIFYLLYVQVFEPCLDRRWNRRLSMANSTAEAELNAKAQVLADMPWRQRLQWTLPFLVLTALLMITNLFPEVRWAMTGGDDPNAQQALEVMLFSVRSRCKSFANRWPWLVHSGTMVIISAVVTPLLCKFNSNTENLKLMEMVELNVGMTGGGTNGLGDEIEHPGKVKLERAQELNRKAMRDWQVLAQPEAQFGYRYRTVMKRAFADAGNEALPVTIAIAGFASLARIMSGFGMTKTLSGAIVGGIQGTPVLFGFFSPLIGALGAGLTGSTTTSNFLFGRLQVQTALDLGLVRGVVGLLPGEVRYGSIWAVCGAQILGSSAGECIAPQNAIFAALVLKGRYTEGAIIKGVLPFTFFFWTLLCMLTGFVALGFINYG